MEIVSSQRFKGSQRRHIKDKLAQFGITLGGIMVLIALILIFVYLLYVVAPTFKGASVELRSQIPLSDPNQSMALGLDETNSWAYRFTRQGQAQFFELESKQQHTLNISLPEQVSISRVARSQPATDITALGLDNGQVWLLQPQFDVSYPNDIRTITPALKYPLGEAGLELAAGQPIEQLSFELSEEAISLVWAASQQALTLTRLEAEVDFLTDEIRWQRQDRQFPSLSDKPKKLLMTPDQRQLFAWIDNQVQVWDISDLDNIHLAQTLYAAEAGQQISEISLLAGASSLLVANNNGVISQWFMTSGADGREFTRIREFDHGSAITLLNSEHFRKSFVVGDVSGGLALYYTTSEQQLLKQQLDAPVYQAAFSSRSNGLIVQNDNGLQVLQVTNQHPEISWSALWHKVWYEGYPEPAHVWQSTSGFDDFEAKLGLMPLVFGTLKAALYAMLFATPLAIAGAVYTAYFMSARMRGIVKPTVEIMEALPTVILGFLAGLWLAPLVESNLPAILLMVIGLPLVILLSAFAWHNLPEHLKNSPLADYRELILIPVLVLSGWALMQASPYLELYFMAGDARGFVTNTLGISFDQRNALVVGLAMGFAVIPTIFSIAEDAVFSVPRHLVNGSLALGATQWQTLTRVVILTASPGIFSAVMMGFGRAVGETMIVLMATGNTPLMDWSIFQGMRTLAANIAVEMPESAIDSTHYRVLFLTAFVLFIFTFIFNTIAELIRQRLREKYSTL